MCNYPDHEVAQITSRLEDAIALRRRASRSSIGALMDGRPPLQAGPNSVELALLAALAQTYGPTIFRDETFGPVLDYIAERGAVGLVQRVLWEERPADVVATRLHNARVAFEILCGTWPEIFLAQAIAELKRLGVCAPRSDVPPFDA
ncbi:hypothetical protein [Caballeronia temeraria]|uniref:hypothetical protein n=1 Tax=Caballeronia temeraria TaxID=1777137 RepID=UPI0012FDDBB7|nr:hypothetical protein [Caballeronia temeraria]